MLGLINFLTLRISSASLTKETATKSTSNWLPNSISFLSLSVRVASESEESGKATP